MKQKLLHAVEAARAKEAETLVPHVDDTPPDVAGRWTVKDTVGHLAAWREYAALELDAVLHGGLPPELAGSDDEQNSKLYSELHHLSAAEIVERAGRSWAALTERVGRATDEQLTGPRPGRPGQEAWEALSGNGYSHLAEHLGYWYAEAGDEAGAEQAAAWAYGIASGIPSGPVQGVAEYNFACFYARRGRAAEALPHLRKGLELRPDLREWAAKDSDLDPIRGETEVARLLQG